APVECAPPSDNHVRLPKQQGCLFLPMRESTFYFRMIRLFHHSKVSHPYLMLIVDSHSRILKLLIHDFLSSRSFQRTKNFPDPRSPGQSPSKVMLTFIQTWYNVYAIYFKGGPADKWTF